MPNNQLAFRQQVKQGLDKSVIEFAKLLKNIEKICQNRANSAVLQSQDNGLDK